jgi:adenine deaminase
LVDLDLLDAALGQREATLAVMGGRFANVLTGEVYSADVAVFGDRVAAIGDLGERIGPETRVVDAAGKTVVPGLIDGHLHLECSKLSVTMFADAVVRFGTTSVVSAFDQIYVVAGLDGVREFLDEAESSPLRIFWGAPFKAPYTVPESNVGFRFGIEEHRIAQAWPECIGVWETVSEFVLNRDAEVLEALSMAHENRLPIFGCAPLMRGGKLAALLAAGIRLDHESYSADEALEKLRAGMYLMIRESSVAHFLHENISVVTRHGVSSGRIAFCTDDVTAGDILGKGHLDNLVRMAVAEGVDPMTALQMATINCASMYRIDHAVGSISPGRFADIVLVDDLESFRVVDVIAKGRHVASDGKMLEPPVAPARSSMLVDTFAVDEVSAGDMTIRTSAQADRVRVLAMDIDPEVPFVRKRRDVELPVVGGIVQPDPGQDALYVTVVERYGKTTNRPVAVVSGFGLRSGAMATSASPDDNNVVCVGAGSEDVAAAVNHLIREGGGQVVVEEGEVRAFLPLPVGGIVADLEPERMAEKERELDDAARALGCSLPSPFGYLIFLSVTAIPDYAITDLGLIDCVNLSVTDPVLEPV